MSGRNTRTLKRAALWLVGFHFVAVALHSAAHEVLSVKASAAQLAFIVPVIIVAPLVAGVMLPKFERAGAAVLLVSMAGSFAFGLYYHFVADTHDHVAHVARLRPAAWSATFQATAYLLLVSELLGAAAGGLSVAGRPRFSNAMQLEQIFNENRRFLWGLCYRMTGSAADSDDILQETFVRLLQKPPADTAEPLRPWLARVAVNLSRDVLRRRRRQSYVGQWLPAPFETENNEDLLAALDFAASHEGRAAESVNPSARYETLESVSFAFLLALELLTPTQRAVLLLRDVFDFNVAETAGILRLTEQNVKTTHHRARRAMRGYEERRFVPRKSLVEKTGRVVAQLVEFLGNRDTEGAARLLAANVVSVSDGGGEFFAAKVPVVGRAKVALFLANLAKATSGAGARTRAVELNGLFGLAIERENPPPGLAPRVAVLFEPDGENLIGRIYFVLASGKLTRLAAAAGS